MNLIRQAKRWKATPVAQRRLVLEAAAMLTVSRLLVAFGLRWSLGWFLRESPTTARIPNAAVRTQVRRAVLIAVRHVPWASLCLPNAMAARLMLARRGYASTLHLGVGLRERKLLHAHAWLESGGAIVTGHKGMEAVVPLPLAR